MPAVVTQWAAVTTHSSSISPPPQRCEFGFPSRSYCREAMNG
nr:hypothetical protein [Actinomadura madurae]